ncbi:uncharacterized protein [Amphiura filiformis]|uniref:uncharacterized protein n=1 Tax=Amphiura filiformis TaxID=82378 RepID=UPI003B21458F
MSALSSNRRSVMISSPIIPTGMEEDGEDFDPTDVVHNANLVTSTTTSIKDWRPMSSISQPEILKNEQDQDLDDDDSEELTSDEDDGEAHRGRKQSSHQPSTTSRPEDVKSRHLDNYVLQRNTLRQPCKYKPHGGPAKGQHKSFITMTQRSRTTFDGIKGTERNLVNAYGDRVCRPYSTYSVSKSCERLAISPYGGPMLPSAVGRYREHHQSRNPPKLSKAVRDALNSKFQKFYINQDLIAITENKKPAGVLKKPPAPKVSRQGERKHNSLHHGAAERMNAVQSTLGWKTPPIVSDGKRFGVGYQVAMELAHNLDKHRRARSANVVPDVPPAYKSPQSDRARLNNQAPEYLTNGEMSIRKSVKANQFDPDKPKKEPTKFVKKRPPSPPLSKLSRDQFLPEALRRREEIEGVRLFSGQSGLRLGKTTRNAHHVEDTAPSMHIGRSLSRLSVQSEDDGGEGSECSELFGDQEEKELMIRGQSAKHTPRSQVGDLIDVDNSYRVTTTPMCSPEPLLTRGSTDKGNVEIDGDEDDDDETKRSVEDNQTEKSQDLDTLTDAQVTKEEQSSNHDDQQDASVQENPTTSGTEEEPSTPPVEISNESSSGGLQDQKENGHDEDKETHDNL